MDSEATSIADLEELTSGAQLGIHLQEFIISYMHVPLAMSVCQEWENFVEDNQARMRSYSVQSVRIYCGEDDTNHCEITGRIVGYKEINHLPLTELIKKIRFLHFENFSLVYTTGEQLRLVNDNMPNWWKSDIKKLWMTIDYDDETKFLLSFISSFPNLHTFRTHDDFLDHLEFIDCMPSIRRLEFGGGFVYLDGFLEAVCIKSKNLKAIEIHTEFTVKSLINFFKEGNFDTTFRIEFESFVEREKGKEELEKFIITTEDYEIKPEFYLAEFTFRNTEFSVQINSFFDS